MSHKAKYAILPLAPQSNDSLLQRYRREASRPWLYLWLSVTTTLLLLTLGLGTQVFKLSRECACTRIALGVGQNPANLPIDRPPVRLVEKVFVNESRYVNREMLESADGLGEVMARWKPLTNRGRGVISLNPADQRDLDPPYHMQSPDGTHYEEVYMLAAFHQLHCLRYIMHSYSTLWQGDDESGKDDSEHILHCFEYLRHSILCSADVTLEGNATVSHGMHDSRAKLAVPWGGRHVCRDWEQISHWADEHVVWESPDNVESIM